MTPMRMAAALLAPLFIPLLVLLSAGAAAAPFSVRLGLERIVLDAPPGFTDTTELASPRLQDLAATLTEDSNRVLLFALTDTDVRRFQLGDQLQARRYMIAVTPKGLERDRVSTAQFSALVNDSLQDLGKPADAADLAKYLESQPIGKASLIAELRREPNAVSVLQALRLPPLPGAHMFDARKPQYQAFTTTLFLIRGKALRLAVYSLYEGPGDLEWLKSVTQRWHEELVRLNK